MPYGLKRFFQITMNLRLMQIFAKADLDGDGIEEQIELVDLKYNGGDGGYALRVTDTKTNEQIPLPDSYREENGFPIFGTYVESDSEKPRLLIQLGEGKQYQTVATIMMDALDLIYDRNLAEFKNVIQNKTSGEKIMADAISGCNVITFQNEETPVVFFKDICLWIFGACGYIGICYHRTSASERPYMGI